MIITVLEPKLINHIKQSNDHRVITIIPILVPENPLPPWLNAKIPLSLKQTLDYISHILLKLDH